MKPITPFLITFALANGLMNSNVVTASSPSQSADVKMSPSVAESAPDSLVALSSDDVLFLENAKEFNDCLVGASEIVIQRSSNSQIKSFANDLVSEHRRLAEQLKQLTAEKKLSVSALISEENRAALENVKSATGANLDRVYTKTFGIDAQLKEIDLFQTASKSASDPAIKSFAEKTLPVLRKQLNSAKKLSIPA